MIVHQLHKILIRRYQKHIYIFGIGLVGHGTNKIIGLIAGLLDIFNAIAFNHLFNQGNANSELFGLRWPICFIIIVHFMAKGRLIGIPGNSNMAGLMFFQQLFQGIGKSQNGSGGNTLRILQVAADKCEV